MDDVRYDDLRSKAWYDGGEEYGGLRYRGAYEVKSCAQYDDIENVVDEAWRELDHANHLLCFRGYYTE